PLVIYCVEPGADLRAMRVVYDRAGSALARIEPRAVDWPRVLAGADWFHASGITPALGDGPAAVLADAIACARAQRIPVSFDLNYREALWRDRRGPAARRERGIVRCGEPLVRAEPAALRGGRGPRGRRRQLRCGPDRAAPRRGPAGRSARVRRGGERAQAHRSRRLQPRQR